MVPFRGHSALAAPTLLSSYSSKRLYSILPQMGAFVRHLVVKEEEPEQ